MPGVNRPAPKRDAPQVAQNQQNPAITRPAILPPRAIDQLLKLERAFRDAAGNASLPHNSGQTAANQPTR